MNSSTFFLMQHFICPECNLSIPRSSMDSHNLYHETIRLLRSYPIPNGFIVNEQPSILNSPMLSPFMLSSIPLMTELYEDSENDYEFNTMIVDMLGNVEVGVSDINKVSQNIEQPLDTPMDCSICLDKAEEPRKLLCEHIFCDKCISTWLSKNKTCPSCRIDLEEALKMNEKIDTANTE
jgi:hypothetical protein